MPLQKQQVPINFAQGLDTKTDPNQVPIGKFLALNNSVFNKTGALTKRNGFPKLTNLPNQDQTTLTTLNNNLIATGSNLYSYSKDTNQWFNQGNIQPVRLDTQTLVRASTSQTSPDMAISAQGIVCLSYTDNGVGYYQISDSSTSEVIARVKLPSTAAAPRSFLLNNYFVVTYLVTISGSTHLQCIPIPTANPTVPQSTIDFGTTVNGLTAVYDGYVGSNGLCLAWAATSSSYQLGYLTPQLLKSNIVTVASTPVNLISVVVDSNAFWVTYWDSSSNNIHTAGYAPVNLIPIFTLPVLIQSGQTLATLTSISTTTSTGSIITVVYENLNYFSSTGAYPTAGVQTDYISTSTLTYTTGSTTASVVNNGIILRSVGLASKPFVNSDGTTYVIATYGEHNQPTYFLIDLLGHIYMRLAYSNGGGFSSQILPSVSSLNDSFYVPYLYKDLLATVNKNTNNPVGTPFNSIYTQTGVNLAKFSINQSRQYSTEIANTLHLTGGQLWMYDGVKPVEHGFHVWPEDIASTSSNTGGGLLAQKYYYQFTYEWTDNQGNLHRSAPSIPLLVDDTLNNPIKFTATFGSGSTTLTVSSVAGLAVGQYIADLTTSANIPVNAYITAVGSTTITISANTTANSATGLGDSLTATPAITFTATFPANSNTITVSSATGLLIGQLITDISNSNAINIDTYITGISGTTVTISQPTTAAGTSNTLVTYNTISNTLYVPTLRLTYKQSGAPSTANNPVRIVGYRWSVAQQTYYQFTSITSPVLNDPTIDYVTIVDTNPDAAILGQTLLYTTGGVVEDIAAPASIASALFKNRLFLVDAEDQNLLWYSKQVIESVPVEMSDLLTLYIAPTTGSQGSTGPITALAAMDDKLVIFKENAIYYITGSGPDNTGANNDFTDPVYITSSVGTSNPDSIVLVPNGLMFQSNKGIWLLARNLSTNYIGAPVENYNSQPVNSALSIPGTNQARFELTSQTLVYDYFFDQWSTFSNLNSISSTLYNGVHTYLTDLGNIYTETPGVYLDGSSPVLMSFTTSWMNVAGLRGYERFYEMLLLGTYYTPFKLNVQLAYDYNSSIIQSTLMLPDNYNPSWGKLALWGSSGVWGGPSNVLKQRLFPQKQKCETFQITVNEIYDPSYGVPSGQGLTLSGLNLTVGVKKGRGTSKAGQSFG